MPILPETHSSVSKYSGGSILLGSIAVRECSKRYAWTRFQISKGKWSEKVTILKLPSRRFYIFL